MPPKRGRDTKLSTDFASLRVSEIETRGKVQGAKVKGQEARGKEQEARGKRQGARDKRQGASGKSDEHASANAVLSDLSDDPESVDAVVSDLSDGAVPAHSDVDDDVHFEAGVAPPSNWWIDAIMHNLAWDHWVAQRFVRVRLGTDFSGAEAPLQFLRSLRSALAKLGVQLSIDHVFSSEDPSPKGRWPRTYIDAVEAPSTLDTDVFNRSAKDLEGIVLDLYVAGFICKSNSTENRYREGMSCQSGQGAASQSISNRSFLVCLQTIEWVLLGVFMLENPRGAPFQLILQTLRRRHGTLYIIIGITSSAADVSATSRPRYLFLGLLRSRVRLGAGSVGMWEQRIRRMHDEVAGLDLHVDQFMLSRSCFLVRSEFRELVARYKKSSRMRAAIHMKPNRQEPNWISEHRSAREALTVDLPWYAVRDGQACLRRVGVYNTSWDLFYSPRQCDLIRVLQALAKEVSGMDAKALWDITAPSTRQRSLQNKIAPCFLTTHLVYHAYHNRHLLGFEHMLIQGFSLRDLLQARRAGVSDSGFRHLAGNTMNVAQISFPLALGLWALSLAGCSQEQSGRCRGKQQHVWHLRVASHRRLGSGALSIPGAVERPAGTRGKTRRNSASRQQRGQHTRP